MQFLDDSIKRTDEYVAGSLPDSILQRIVGSLTLSPKVAGLVMVVCLFAVFVLHSVLHHSVKATQLTGGKSRLINNLSVGIVFDACLHRAFQCNNRMSARLYLGLYPVGNGIDFQGEHQLLGVVIGL